MMAGPVGLDGLERTGKSPVHHAEDPAERRMYASILAACQGGLQFFHSLHTEGVWIPENSARQMAVDCDSFAVEYAKLARECFQLGRCRFRMEPCLHHWQHFATDIRGMLDKGVAYVYSAGVDLCEADEDFVGKISRTSRCVHMSSMSRRTIQRYRLKLKFEWCP